MFEFSDTQKIGMLLVGFGCAFLFLGVLLFFDSALLAMGNVLFISGVSLLIGLQKAFSFFFGVKKLQGSAFFFGGVLLVLMGWAIIGMLIEMAGLFMLFSGFMPRIIPLLRHLPVVSAIFYIPGMNALADRLSAGGLGAV